MFIMALNLKTKNNREETNIKRCGFWNQLHPQNATVTITTDKVLGTLIQKRNIH